MSKGFTLVEVLVVIVVLAVLASMVFGLMHYVESSRINNTETRVFGVGLEVVKHASVKGFPPAKLQDLKVDGLRLVDGWDRPLEYKVNGKEFKLWSCGPDGVSGTADDIQFRRN